MDREFYYAALDRMEKAGVNGDYIQGWAAGYLGNPKREEQRATDAYEAGYEHGESADDQGFDDWKAA